MDYVVMAGPVISKHFLGLWKDILLKLKERKYSFPRARGRYSSIRARITARTGLTGNGDPS